MKCVVKGMCKLEKNLHMYCCACDEKVDIFSFLFLVIKLLSKVFFWYLFSFIDAFYWKPKLVPNPELNSLVNNLDRILLKKIWSF